MNIQTAIDTIVYSLISKLQTFLPGIEQHVIRYGTAATLTFIAIVLLALALRAIAGSHKRHSEVTRDTVPQALHRQGDVIDLLNSDSEDDVAVRMVVTSTSSRKIRCEIVERLNVIKSKPGETVRCMFAPVSTDSGKVNCFATKLIESDTSGGKIDRIILGSAIKAANIPRRKHPRKRVADQQFIRVKLWVDNPYVSDIAHEDAAPHIGVNSFTDEGQNRSASTVVNISNGGLALNVQNRNIPETCAIGASVAINLFMFNFKEKTFKPYWYSGEVRSMEETIPGFTRMGLAFNGNGLPCEETGKVRWARF